MKRCHNTRKRYHNNRKPRHNTENDITAENDTTIAENQATTAENDATSVKKKMPQQSNTPQRKTYPVIQQQQHKTIVTAGMSGKLSIFK